MIDDNPESGPTRPRVVVVDDHDMFRAGVIASLGDGVEVIAEADDVESAIAAIVTAEPDVVLLDVHLPSGNGADVIEGVAGSGVATRYLGLSVSDAPGDVMGLVQAGAQGYVTKRINGVELVAAIEQVAQGNAIFSPRLAAYVLAAFREHQVRVREHQTEDNAPLGDAVKDLTGREREVMLLLARGFTYKEIAAELFISTRTVESHTSAVLRKLQLSNRNELAHWAARNDLL